MNYKIIKRPNVLEYTPMVKLYEVFPDFFNRSFLRHETYKHIT